LQQAKNAHQNQQQRGQRGGKPLRRQGDNPHARRSRPSARLNWPARCRARRRMPSAGYWPHCAAAY
jgi:hypothetical protein